jgi:hypothetical protein
MRRWGEISKVVVRKATNGYIVKHWSPEPFVGWVETIFENESADNAIQFAIEKLDDSEL